MKKLLLIDGNSIANRAFYGTGANMLKNAEGLYTGAVYGFVNMLMKAIESEKPELVCVAFDAGRHTFRHDMYSGYKANRKGMPDELRVQMPVIKEVLDAFGIAHTQAADIEADDIIGTLSKEASKRGVQSVILTGDKDSLQLVDGMTTVLLPVTSAGTTTVNRVIPEKVAEVFNGAPAEWVVPMKALMGDSSDNIPGCPGIGPKGALALLTQFGGLDEIFAGIDEVASKSTREKLENNKDLCYLSLELAKIKRDVPLDVITPDGSLESLEKQKTDYAELLRLFKKLEFRKLIKSMKLEELAENDAAEARGNSSGTNVDPDSDDAELSLFDAALGGAGNGEATAAEGSLKDSGGSRDRAVKIEARTPEELKEAAGALSQSDEIYLIIEKNKGDLSAVTVYGRKTREDGSETPGEYFYIPLPDGGAVKQFAEAFSTVLGGASVKKYFFDAKPLITACLRHGVKITPVTNDVAICAYLADSTRKLDEYESAVRFFTGKDRPEIDFMPEVCEAACKKLCADGMKRLLEEIELPMISVLAGMETRGVKVDPEVLKKEGEKYSKNLESLKERIYELCGTEFNINSPRQLGEVLFDKLGLGGGKKNKTKTGYKTGQEILEEIADEHPVIPLILEYRQNAKLKSTYIDGLLSVIDGETGRVYSTFNQTVTATGRLSSSEPNLQNIPVRHELGREIRKAFVAGSPDGVLVDADYSQIELRLLAVMSGDENMIAAFESGEDIHTLTAADVNGIEPSEVTYEMRSAAKAVNFGIVYGMSEYGLAREIGVSVAEARRYIAGYFRKFPGVRTFLEELKSFAKRNGFAVTPWGRRRYLPELINPKYPVRQFGERVATNMPIQGAAADIIKLAMVRVENELEKRGLKSRLVLQVHDELLVDCPREEEETVRQLLKECMEGVADFGLRLPVSTSSGYSWEKQ